MKLCQHCNTDRYIKGRGLCYFCYSKPAIKSMYSPKTNQRDIQMTCSRAGDFYGGYHPPAKPTPAMPGTEAKMQALAERVANRVALWHHQDADGGD